jgi:hypothetical protein
VRSKKSQKLDAPGAVERDEQLKKLGEQAFRGRAAELSSPLGHDLSLQTTAICYAKTGAGTYQTAHALGTWGTSPSSFAAYTIIWSS